MGHGFCGSLQRSHLADPQDGFPVRIDNPELEVLVGVVTVGIRNKTVSHLAVLLIKGRYPDQSSPAICWILITTNSAGLSGAKPTSMLTIPRFRSAWVVVSPSHLT